MAAMPDFMSLAPRPYSLPSRSSPPRGGTLQGAVPRGTVSMCPAKHRAGPGRVPGRRATKLARPVVTVPPCAGAKASMVTANPAGARMPAR